MSKTRTINLTQHPATPEQIAEGVVPVDDVASLHRELTFDPQDVLAGGETFVRTRARYIVEEHVLPFVEGHIGQSILAVGDYYGRALIGGAPYLMEPLAQELRRIGVVPVYSVSERRSTEQEMPDGTVRKVGVFAHLGFLEVPNGC